MLHQLRARARLIGFGMQQDVRVRTKLGRVLRPLTARTTYLRWAHLILGGVAALPYLALGWVLRVMLATGLFARLPESIALGCCAVVVLAALGATAAVPHVRRLERSTARELLGVDLGEEPAAATTKSAWWRTGMWVVVHLASGLLIAALTLVVAPFIVVLLASPVLTVHGAPTGYIGLGTWWAPLIALALFVAGYAMVNGFGIVLERLAPPLLGPSTQDQLATARRQVARLAERDRLASELHDSVGHALSIVTLQAGAAARGLDTDPTFARNALTTIEESARRALDDLDHVLGLLREDRDDRTPTGTLDDLTRLVRSTETAGLRIVTEVDGELSRVPGPVSREAYRTVREGLTNALRHAGKVRVTVRISVSDEDFVLAVRNPLGPPTTPDTGSHGLGITGIEQRVRALGGEVDAGREDAHWQLRVRLPLRSTP